LPRRSLRSAAGPARNLPVPRKALVLGDDTRSFLAVVRSLGRQGIEVHAAPLDFASPALRSRYVTKIHRLPLWRDDGAEWLDAVEALLRAEEFEAVIPCSETALLPFARHRARFRGLSNFAIPDDRSVAVLFDKHQTRQLAQQAGVAVPPGRLMREDDTAEVIVAEFGLPVVVKPRRSYAIETLHTRGKVRVIRAVEDLAAVLPTLVRDEHLIEGFFPGRGVGLSVLASKGVLLQAFQHDRVRESQAGASFYRVSVSPAADLDAACAAMTGALGYTGVAMFEFRRNDAGSWVLLEVNARPWGSLPLPVSLGVDFPWRWYRLVTEGVETPAVSYRAGVYGRNLVPDGSQLVEDVRQAGLGAPFVFLHRGAELARNATGRERQDTIVRDDVWPGLIELGGAVRRVAARVWRKLPRTAAVKQILARRKLRALARGGPLVFVCSGNICRSPYAEIALAARHPDLVRRIAVTSAGTLPRDGRLTPPFGLAAAAARGVDLHAHRSRHLTDSVAEGAGAILVFDSKNWDDVVSRFPQLRDRLLIIGDLAGFGPIDDPVDGNRSVFDVCYKKVDAALAAAAEVLGDSPVVKPGQAS